MGDCYLQFSMEVEIKKQAEKEWLIKYLPLFDDSFEETIFESLAQDAKACNAEEGYKVIERLIREGCTQAWSILPSEPNKGEGVWFYAEENGTPELVLAILHIFMAHFDLDGYLDISWCCHGEGQFEGGAGLACKEGFDLWDASAAIYERYSQLRSKA